MSENKFRTEVNVEITYDSEKPEGFEYEFRNSKANIDYIIAIDMRDWGIRDITPYAIGQEIEIDVELQDSSEEVDTYVFKIKVEEIKTEIDDITSRICPDELTLDLKNIVKTGKREFTATATGVLTF